MLAMDVNTAARKHIEQRLATRMLREFDAKLGDALRSRTSFIVMALIRGEAKISGLVVAPMVAGRNAPLALDMVLNLREAGFVCSVENGMLGVNISQNAPAIRARLEGYQDTEGLARLAALCQDQAAMHLPRRQHEDSFPG